VALQQSIGFLGFGNMGQAIGDGLIDAGEITTSQLVLYDLFAEKLAPYAEQGATIALSPRDLAANSDILILATKPQYMEAALIEIKAQFSLDTVVISIAAGLSISFFEKHLGNEARIIRVMPNTPAMVSAGAAGYALNSACTETDEAIAHTVFNTIGIGLPVPESSIDAVTAISGSGPAYFFYFVECICKAGVELGLSEEQATKLAVQTLYGAGRLLVESEESAQSLREKVTSKGGTTHAALKSFRDSQLEQTVLTAMRAAADRSRELGK
jgi:pyrroline-5-carboxylate reductase